MECKDNYIINYWHFNKSPYCLKEFSLQDFNDVDRYIKHLLESKLFEFNRYGLSKMGHEGARLLVFKKACLEVHYELSYPIGFEKDVNEKPFFMWFAITHTNNMYYDYDENNKVYRLKNKYEKDGLCGR